MFVKAMMDVISQVDPQVAKIVQAEDERQRKTICLIPSENYCSAAVSYALAASLGNKYAEGYPHVWKDGSKQHSNGRYYQGQKNTNAIEALAIERALKLFTPDPSAYHANVQPLSGSPANLAVLSAFLKPGEPFLGMSLDDGGHLTHGHKVSVTGQYYQAIQYGLNEKGIIDYDQIEKLAQKHKPKVIFSGATAYPLQIDFEKIGKIAKSVNAIFVADISHICGLCVAGEHPHPFPHADVITTTTHKILRGPRGGVMICKKEHGQIIDKAVFPGLQGGPHMNTIAAMAIAFKNAMEDSYQQYAKQVIKNATVLAGELKKAGFRLVCGGTENHLILVDVVNSRDDLKAKDGAWLAARLEQAGLIVNKNAISGDPKPWIPSGIRLGTPAVTTLGMKEKEMKKIANWIVKGTKNANDDHTLSQIQKEVEEFMMDFQPEKVLSY